ncbi:TetR/AcrR family transcriptional regulator [Gordonia sp. X0973]|uniref:TetR/AcrR family transcriptional regulator n=1 Tax=Gordonia sp. X0973 TaxID=2742602 RepID=UPI000F53A06C|nr:TetR/AcrR family transcriptional regulator [Gordonia sp. X0973]QKT07640.1 TetR/AcrR family transcriptional regulator [Gordonia sp. X0973]
MSSASPDLPRHLQLMWELDDGTRRGPKPKLTIGDIGATAAAIADDQGLDAVSMKAIADRLDVTPMSLYRYVEAKEDVYDVMFDEAYGSPDPALLDGLDTWRDRLTAWALAVTDRMVAHPWVTALPMTRPPAGPRTLRWTDVGIAAFDGTRLPDAQRLSILLLVSGFLRNHVRMSADMGAFEPDRPSSADHYNAVLGHVIDEQRYPNLTRAVRGDFADDDENFFTDELRVGLDLILDGVAARIAADG